MSNLCDNILELPIGGRLSPALVALLDQACDHAADAPGRPLVLRLRSEHGAGPAVPPDVHLISRWERALGRIERLPGISIVLAEGGCGPLALSVLLATDHRIASPDLRACLVGPHGEIMPDMLLHRLVQQIGVSRTRALALFGRELDAAAALELGLVGEIAGDPAAAASAFLLSLPAAAMRDLPVRRRLLLDATTTAFDEALGAHLAACDRSLRMLACAQQAA